MKGLLDRLLKSLGVSGRDWVVLLLALLLAFSTWLVHNLSLKYNDYLKVSIAAQCSIDGHSEQSDNVCEVIARCRATGYNVIRLDIRSKNHVRKIRFQPEVMKHKEGDMFYVTSSDLHEYSHLIFGDDVTVEYFVSDTLFFDFPRVEHKRVPVHPVFSVSFKSQYMSIGGMEVQPDSVTIYGEPYQLDNIEAVYTQPIRKVELDTDIRGVVQLERIRDVRISQTDVRYSMDVSRFVEISAKVPVTAIGLPADKEMVVLPSGIEVALKCSFPIVGSPEDELRLYVDYADFLGSLSGKCPVKMSGIPKGVIGYELEPCYVECIVRDR